MDLHSFTKSIFAIDSITEETMAGIIDYFTVCGYDADDLNTQLGLTKATSFLHRLLFNHADKVDNPNFVV